MFLAAIYVLTISIVVSFSATNIQAQGEKQKTPVQLQTPSKKNGSRVLRLRAFADRLLTLKDVKTKSIAVARLANLLWQDDQAYARNLFTTAATLSAPKSDTPKAEASELLRIHAEIISLIARRDAALAKRLTQTVEPSYKQADASERARVDFHSAFTLLDSDTGAAVKLVQSSASAGVPPFAHAFLIELRQKDVATANNLFLTFLNQLVANPGTNADSLLLMGTYVFTSPQIDPNDRSIPANRVVMIGIGNQMVPDISLDRPNVSPNIVRSYLAAAQTILAQQVSNPTRSESFYVAGRMLLTKFEKFAPDLAQQMYSVVQALANGVTPQLQQDSAYQEITSTTRPDIDEILASVEKEDDVNVRDQKYLAVVADLWNKGDFGKARSVAAKISDDEARPKLGLIITFKEVALKVESSDQMSDAEEIARKLPDSVERAMLWLGITHNYVKAGDKERAAMAAQTLLASVRKIKTAHRPYLLLRSAGELAAIDLETARAVLVEAVNDFNQQKPESLAELEWEEQIEIGALSRDFPIGIKGILCNFNQPLTPLMKADSDATVAAIENLRNDKPLAEALLAVASVTLKD